jgi:hypothetical protein
VKAVKGRPFGEGDHVGQKRLILRPFQQLRQLGDTGRDLSRLILGHEIGRGTSARSDSKYTYATAKLLESRTM